MKAKDVLGAAAAVGLAAAIFSSARENETIEKPVEKKDNRFYTPISSIIPRQENIESLSCAKLREIFIEKTEHNTNHKLMIVSQMKDNILESLGYKQDIELDKEHYLFCMITEKESNTIFSSLLINFTEMEEKLFDMLNSCNGLLRISGD